MNELLFNAKENFDAIKHYTQSGQECWFARELYPLLGYSTWQKFEQCIQRSIVMCSMSGIPKNHHFNQVVKMVQLGSGSQRQINDYMLSRYACYLIAINGNTQECAYAQAYFITTTMKYEDDMMQQHYDQLYQLQVREKCKEADKRFSAAMLSHEVPQSSLAKIKSKGDEAYFGGYNTKNMKDRLGCSYNKSLYDVLDPDVAMGRALAAGLSARNINNKDIQGTRDITIEHVNNNDDMRVFMIDHSIVPEMVAPVVDSKYTQKYINNEEDYLAENCSLIRNVFYFDEED